MQGLFNEIFKEVRREGIKATVLRGLDYKTGILSFLLSTYASKKFKSIVNWIDALNYVFSDDSIAYLIRPAQIREEIAKLLGLLEELRPRVVLEIGTARGGTLFLWTRVAAPDALIISIDLPGGPFGGGYPFLKSFLYKRFALNRQKIVLLRANSHDTQTYIRIRKLTQFIDFLFIDGDHSYIGVKKDFELYSPLVKKGGIIAFHDIVPGSPELVGGVPEFWKELKNRINLSGKEQYEIIEIVKNWKQGGYGIGVLIKKG